MARKPKAREIHAADFLDRMVRLRSSPNRQDTIRIGGRIVPVNCAGGQTSHVLTLKPLLTEKLRAVIASYLGYFRHADSYRLCLSIFRQ